MTSAFETTSLSVFLEDALPSGNLVVPVIKGADMLNLIGLSKTVNGLADAAIAADPHIGQQHGTGHLRAFVHVRVHEQQ